MNLFHFFHLSENFFRRSIAKKLTIAWSEYDGLPHLFLKTSSTDKREGIKIRNNLNVHAPTDLVLQASVKKAIREELNANKINKKPIRFSCRLQDHIGFFDYDEIIYMQADKATTRIVLKNTEVISKESLKTLESRLPKSLFLRISKQNLVNLYYIKSAEFFLNGSYIVFLEDSQDTHLTVGRKYAQDFLSWIHIRKKS